MNTVRQLRMLAIIMGAATLCMSPAAAIVIEVALDFVELPNEGGIAITEVINPDGVPPDFTFDLTFPGESVQISDLDGFRRLGRSGPGTLIFNLTNPLTGLLSDQVTIAPCIPSNPGATSCEGGLPSVITFTSDADDSGASTFDLGPATTTTEEDGTRQFVGSYRNNNGDTVGVFVTSDLESTAVPEPATLALLALGLVGLGLSRRNKA